MRYPHKSTKWDGLWLCLSPFFFIVIPLYVWLLIEKVRHKDEEGKTNE